MLLQGIHIVNFVTVDINLNQIVAAGDGVDGGDLIVVHQDMGQIVHILQIFKAHNLVAGAVNGAKLAAIRPGGEILNLVVREGKQLQFRQGRQCRDNGPVW